MSQNKMKRVIPVFLFLLSFFLGGCSKTIEIEMSNELAKDEVLKTAFMEWKIEKTEFVKDVSPSAPSGYYHRFESNENEWYFCINTKLKNKTDITMNADNIESMIEINGRTYTGIIRLETSEHKDLTTEIKGNEELTAYVFFKVSEKEDEIPEQVVLYYEEKFRKQEEEGNYRYQTNWRLK